MNPKMTVSDAAAFRGVTAQAIHNLITRYELKVCKATKRVNFNHQAAKEIFRLKFQNKVVAVQIVKGGAGKTLVVKNLAIRSALYGARVLVIDLDQQANLTNHFISKTTEVPVMMDVIEDDMPLKDAIINALPGLDIVPSNLNNSFLDTYMTMKNLPLDRVLKERIDSVKGNYDLVLIDCPPALSPTVAAAAIASDTVLAPVNPDSDCLHGLMLSHGELQVIAKRFKAQINLRVVINKFDSRTSLSPELMATLHKHPVFSKLLFSTFVRLSQEFPASAARGESIFDTTRMTSAQEDIDSLTREILEINNQRPKVESELAHLEALNASLSN